MVFQSRWCYTVWAVIKSASRHTLFVHFERNGGLCFLQAHFHQPTTVTLIVAMDRIISRRNKIIYKSIKSFLQIIIWVKLLISTVSLGVTSPCQSLFH